MPCRGEPRGCPFIIQAHSPIYGTMHTIVGLSIPSGFFITCRDAMPRVFSPTGFNVIFTRFHLVLNQDLQDL